MIKEPCWKFLVPEIKGNTTLILQLKHSNQSMMIVLLQRPSLPSLQVLGFGRFFTHQSFPLAQPHIINPLPTILFSNPLGSQSSSSLSFLPFLTTQMNCCSEATRPIAISKS